MSLDRQLLACSIANELRSLRNAARMTQQDVADWTGLHRPIVARIESGRHLPDIETVGRYLRAVRASWLDLVEVLDGGELPSVLPEDDPGATMAPATGD